MGERIAALKTEDCFSRNLRWVDDDKVLSFKKMLWRLVYHEEDFPAGKKF